MLFFLAEALLEYEQQFAQWRFKHVQLVERIIGSADRRDRRHARLALPDADDRPDGSSRSLWEVRARFFGAKKPPGTPKRGTGTLYIVVDA